MGFSIEEQLECLLYSLVAGVLLGVVYDIFRAIRLCAEKKKALTVILDILFMLICAVVSVFFSMGFSRGYTRYFTIIGEICGFLAVRFTIGRVSVRAIRFIFGKIKKKSKQFTELFVKIAKKVLKNIRRILYNINRKKLKISSKQRLN